MADAVFYIIDGKCKVTVVSEKGKEAVVALHEKGDFFGEGCLSGQPRRLATVTAIAVSEIMRIDKATMVRALHDEPKFSELFMSHLLARNVRVEADLVDQLFNSSEKRLARLLLLMANFGKEGRPEPVIAKVSQENSPQMVGTTRSRVSFFMNKFRKLGFIDYNGSLEVHSSLLNMVLHETRASQRAPTANDRWVSNFDQFFVGLPISLYERRQSVGPRLAEGVVRLVVRDAVSGEFAVDVLAYRGYVVHFRAEVLSWRFMAAPPCELPIFLGEHPGNFLQGKRPWPRPRSRSTTCCWGRRNSTA